MKKQFLTVSIFLLLGLLPMIIYGQGKDDKLRAVTHTVALTNVMIITEPGAEAILGNVVIKNGLIQSVGKNADYSC